MAFIQDEDPKYEENCFSFIKERPTHEETHEIQSETLRQWDLYLTLKIWSISWISSVEEIFKYEDDEIVKVDWEGELISALKDFKNSRRKNKFLKE